MRTDDSLPRSPVLRRVYPWLIQLWIGYVLLSFFLIRILGSGTVQRLIAVMKLRLAR